jgi:elongation factor P
MKIGGNEIRPGHLIQHQGRLWRAVKIQHTQPGKGGAYLQVELKDIKTGTKMNERFRSSESVERIQLEEQVLQYLYAEGDMLTFMNTETYDQIELAADLLGDGFPFLEEGMSVTVSSFEGEIVSVQLPTTVVAEIVEAEPVVRGQTATSSFKPAKLANGLRIMVPPYVESGEKVVVNTADVTFVERAK